jgi:DNA end-binding protein Ku
MPSTVWKGFLTFGLVSVPVRLYAAARSKSIHFNRLYRRRALEVDTKPDTDRPEPRESPRTPELPDNVLPISRVPSLVSSPPAPSATQLSRVTQEFRPVGEQNTVNPSDLVQGYEYGPDQYVVVEKNEAEDLVPKTSTTMDLEQFVKLGKVDPIFFERSYYVVPEPGGEKAYALLFQAMRRTGYCGVASVAMHRRQHIIILRPDERRILAHTMYYADEIRDAPDISVESGSVTEKELRLAETFINALAGPFRPENFRDEYRSGLESLIEGKVRRDELITPAPTRGITKAVDIMEALKASLKELETPKQPPKRVGPKPTRVARDRRRRGT